jgi:hypothetical protein
MTHSIASSRTIHPEQLTLVDPVTIGQLLVGALRYGRTRAAVQLRGLRSSWAGGGLVEGTV